MTINPAWFGAGGVCAAAGLFASGERWRMASQIFGPTLRQFDDPSRMAITFDDGPNPGVTPAALEVLRRYGRQLHFF